MGVKKTDSPAAPPSPPPAPAKPEVAPACQAPAPATEEGAQAKGKVYSDGFVTVDAARKVTVSSARALALRVEEAYRFDAEAQHWDNPAPLGSAVTVKLQTDEGVAWAANTSAAAGVATNDHTFVVGLGVGLLRSGDDDDMIAHELSHIQDDREGGKHIDKVPRLIQEGKAWILGARFGWREGHTSVASLAFTREQLKGVTAEHAQQTLHPFIASISDSEPTAGLFIEFLRTRLGGSGFADAIPRLAQMIHRVGDGMNYDEAFQAEFAVSPKGAEAAFLGYLRQTEGNPAERFRGTLFDWTVRGDLLGRTADGQVEPTSVGTARTFLSNVTEAGARADADVLRSAASLTPPIGDSVAALYLEFLRTRYKDAGVPDAPERLLKVLAGLPSGRGHGKAFDQAFSAAFGAPPKDVEGAFFKYLGMTERDADARFKGTIYQSAGAASCPPAP